MTDVLALLVAVIAAGVAVLALRRADVVERRVRRWATEGRLPEPEASAPATPATPPAAAPAQVAELAELGRRLERVESGSAGVNRVAVVRYDAFEDVGGRMSFSAALLDDQGRGLVLTAIHGRGETRSYVKQLPAPDDDSQRELSPEENQAVARAMGRSR